MKKNFFILFAMAGLLPVLTSCNNENEGPNPPLPDAEPIVLKSEYQTKTTNNYSFALELFKNTVACSGGENIFISPYSVNVALSMAWNGSAGETADEMALVLGNATYTREQINDYTKTLTDALLKVDPSTELMIANSLWADHTTPFLPGFVETNQTWYNAVVKNVDFSNNQTFKDIDQWCLNNTNNRIERISEGMNEYTKFALINAVYFKGKWKHTFDKSSTRNESFTNSAGKKVTVPMMNQSEKLLYADDDKDWKMVSLPYGNQAFSMIILMPYEDVPLDDKLATLTAEKFYSLIETMGNYTVAVKLPTFKAEYAYKLHEQILPAMGIESLFDNERANLREMSNKRMYVNMVMHKTFMEVNEEGTEAAAATAISGEYTSVGPGTPVEFFVDRPFIYSIIENSTGTILFMGRVNEL